jgi:hypothetical protein
MTKKKVKTITIVTFWWSKKKQGKTRIFKDSRSNSVVLNTEYTLFTAIKNR